MALDEREPAYWQALQAPGLTAFERDRVAILAMAGEFRTSFDFLEIAGFTPAYQPTRPYRSWGTEKVYVIEDRGDFISLQHVLVMRIRGADGTDGPPIVTKHWRQDWRYEPHEVLVYRGRHTWERIAVDPATRRGAWSQTVYQVDDSPRYGDVGRWQHEANYSAWTSGEGWRPLPRREFSVRDDYDVLVGTNRHVILPRGWVHEQANNKRRLGTPEQPAAVLARELGINRYERIRDFDFTPGDRYLGATAALWQAVRAEWDALAGRGQPLRLRGAPDADQLFMPLWALAAEVESMAELPDDLAARARALVRDYLADSPAAAP